MQEGSKNRIVGGGGGLNGLKMQCITILYELQKVPYNIVGTIKLIMLLSFSCSFTSHHRIPKRSSMRRA